MTPEEVNAIGLALFTAGLVACVASTAWRIRQFWRYGIPQPRLIWRDVLTFGLLGLDFLVILIHRVGGAPFAGTVWFSGITVAIACAAIAVWLYFELVVIGHRRDRR